MKISFLADQKPAAMFALRQCIKKYGQADLAKADVVVVLGGDGFMLKTLHALLNYQTPVFGLNLGHVGYLLNNFSIDQLPDRVDSAEKMTLMPLKMQVETTVGRSYEKYAFNEFAFCRMKPQAARLKVVATDDDKHSKSKIVDRDVFGDGMIVASSIGSHGYYASANGQPFDQEGKIGVQSVCCKENFNMMFSPQAHICVTPQELPKRSIHVDCDGQERICNVHMALIENESKYVQTLLKDRKTR